MKQALATWNNAHDLAADNGDRARLLEINVLRAEALIGMEDWQQAAALMVDALEIAKDINDPELLSGIYRVQAAISLERVALETADLDSEKAVQVARESGARMQVARALLVRACVLGTRALSEKGARSTVIDRKCTEAFEDALTGFREMGDIVRLAAALRSYVSYLSQRGGGPRLTAVQVRLQEVESELNKVAALTFLYHVPDSTAPDASGETHGMTDQFASCLEGAPAGTASFWAEDPPPVSAR